MRRWLAAVLLAAACVLSAHAEGVAAANNTTDREAVVLPPIPQYLVAGLSTIVVLIIVCLPSRKE